MIRTDYRDRIVTARIQLHWIIWGAFLMSLVIYSFIAALMQQSLGKTPVVGIPEQLYWALAALSLPIGLGAVGMRLMLLQPGKLVTPGPAPEYRARTEAPANEAEARFLSAVTRVTTYCIICWAMLESIAVMGLLTFFLSHRFTWFIPMVVAAGLALLMVTPPRRELFDDLARRAEQVP